MSLNMFIVEEKLSFYDSPVHLILGSQLISPKLNFTCSLPAVNSFAPESSWCLLLARSILRRLTCAAKKTQFSVKKINLVPKKNQFSAKKIQFTGDKIKISGDKIKNRAEKTQKLTNKFNGIHSKRVCLWNS